MTANNSVAQTVAAVSAPALSPEQMAVLFSQFLATAAGNAPVAPVEARKEADTVITLKSLCDLYMRQYQGRDTSRVTRLSYWISRYGNLPVTDITSRLIRASLQELLTKPAKSYKGKDADGNPILKAKAGNISGSTCNRYAAALSAVLSWAIDEELVPDDYVNPCTKVKPMKEGQPRDRVVTPEEAERLLTAARKSKWPMLWPIVRIGLAIGARRGEIAGMTWDDTDLEAGTTIFRGTKNGDDRPVPLPADVCEFLKPHQKKSGLIFGSSRAKNQPMRFERLWQIALDEAGLKRSGIVFHSLRHTCITNLISQGNNAIQVQALVGHKSLHMTARYSHLDVDAKRRMIEK